MTVSGRRPAPTRSWSWDDRLRRAPSQGPPGGALRRAGGRCARSNAALRRTARDQPAVRRRARGGGLRPRAAGAGRPHRAVRGEGQRTGHLLDRAGADRGADLRPLLPRYRLRPAALRADTAAREPGAGRDRHRDLDDRHDVERARPARAADPAAAAGAAGDRRGGRRRTPAGRGWARLRALRHVAGAARPLRSDLPPGRLRHLRLLARGLGTPMEHALQSITLRRLAIATVAVLGAGYALAFFYAPEDADQGFIQKIFYLHVPLAMVALLGWIVAAVHAIRHLQTGDPVHDARSYVSIHMSVIFGVAVLVTGAIWARGSWGVWW